MTTMYVHFDALPQGMTLTQVEGDLSEAVDDKGAVTGGYFANNQGRIEIELLDEDDNQNPKYAQLTVKSYLQSVNFPRSTTVEIGCMEIPLYN